MTVAWAIVAVPVTVASAIVAESVTTTRSIFASSMSAKLVCEESILANSRVEVPVTSSVIKSAESAVILPLDPEDPIT